MSRVPAAPDGTILRACASIAEAIRPGSSTGRPPPGISGIPLKLFAGASVADLALRWDDTAGPTEERLSQLCRWVLDADSRGYRYALSLPGLEIPGDSGEAQRAHCLEALALFGLPDYEALVARQC